MISSSSGRIFIDRRYEASMHRLVEASSGSLLTVATMRPAPARAKTERSLIAPAASLPVGFAVIRYATRIILALFLATGFAMGLHLYAGPSSLGITTEQAFLGFFAWCFLLVGVGTGK